jgi:toxin YoeB
VSERRSERDCCFDAEFRADLAWWVRAEPRTALRLLRMVDDVMREPFTGTGKPEPLRHLGPDLWSRRITDEHRLVYHVAHDRITFLQGRFHYRRS